MPASARVLLLLAPALLVQQAHCSEVSELCTEGPMALGLASEGQPPSSRNPDKLYVYSLKPSLPRSSRRIEPSDVRA